MAAGSPLRLYASGTAPILVVAAGLTSLGAAIARVVAQPSMTGNGQGRASPAARPGRTGRRRGRDGAAQLHVRIRTHRAFHLPRHGPRTHVLHRCHRERGLGKTYTPAQCRAQRDRDLERHAAGIAMCIPLARLKDARGKVVMRKVLEEVRGLTRRRQAERELCLKGLP